jgi:hypothetical protein
MREMFGDRVDVVLSLIGLGLYFGVMALAGLDWALILIAVWIPLAALLRRHRLRA